MTCKKCSESDIELNTTTMRSNTLFKIYCKFLLPHIKKVKQKELINLTSATNACFTIFKKNEKNYIRKKTTLTKKNGEYAINSILDPTSLAYIALTNGQSFKGIVTIYDKSYYAWYWVINNDYAGFFGSPL